MSKMNWKAVTIVLATSIPIIIVAIIIFRSTVDINDSSCKANETCVRYCCHHDLICNGVPHNFTNETFGKNLKHPYKLLPGLRCEHEAYLGILEDITFFDNGHIDESGKRIPWKHYCVDKNISEYIFKICFNPNEMELIRETYPYFMTASLPFLIITLLVYGFVKDLRNLHGKCLMAYASSLTIMYVTLIINSFTEDVLLNYKIGCMTVGYTFLTSLLCCFFWLNVMCYDIYRAFRVEIKSESNGQFIKFCAYAFGIPIVYMTIVFVLNYYRLIPDEYNNNIGYGSCLISNNFGQDIHQNSIQWIYIYGPILLLISVNIIFYGITAWKFFCVERDRARVCRTSTSRIHHGQCDNSENRIRFLCYLRLSIIMGLPWIIEILSFSINNTWLFAVSIFNCLQGFVVFIIFVWNPRVTKHLKRRYTGLSERNNFLRSRMDLPERNGPIGGSAATLLDGPVIDQSPDNDNYNSNESFDESSQNSRVLNEMREKIERMS